VNRVAAVATCWLLAGAQLAAQERPQLTVALNDSAGIPEAYVGVRALLSDDRLLRAMESGFPLHMEYHVELRKTRPLFDRTVSEWTLEYVVLYDPVRDVFVVEDTDGTLELSGRRALRERLSAIYVFGLRPPEEGRFHYRAQVRARTLSDEDVDEVFAWLKGEDYDSEHRDRPGFLTRTARRLLIQVAPLPELRLEARTENFRYR
jgi:hypothetical protein